MNKKLLLMWGTAVVLVAATAAWWWLLPHQEQPLQPAADSQPTASSLDLTKLPLGDGKYSSSARQGYVYACQSSFNGGGAFAAGPWIDEANKTWNLTAKIAVAGSVGWPNATWTISNDGSTRSMTGNNLPINHTSGTFPVQPADDAYQYDRNPNTIQAQLAFNVPINPARLEQPQCVGGEVGIMLSGVPLFNAFDAGGRDAVAWEVQDHCEAHPQAAGQYHYHGFSDCFTDASAGSQHSALLGYAFDGFGVYGLKGEDGVQLASSDLDECHGHEHQIEWDGQNTTIYHYHFTLDFPYSVSCFRAAKAVSGPLAPAGPMAP